MSFQNPVDQITYTWQRLDAQWSATTALWRDGVRMNFETQFYKPVETALFRYREALHLLDIELKQIEREVPRI